MPQTKIAFYRYLEEIGVTTDDALLLNGIHGHEYSERIDNARRTIDKDELKACSANALISTTISDTLRYALITGKSASPSLRTLGEKTNLHRASVQALLAVNAFQGKDWRQEAKMTLADYFDHLSQSEELRKMIEPNVVVEDFVLDNEHIHHKATKRRRHKQFINNIFNN
ncbi:hypothetical protein [Vibrio barjaei]|uniref:hypothetical protein n=1 Tax=Vibrio barjaei TaxID=1676683 RepID=UPI002284EAE5|nr:hypothetical protein [Vibrio barjaei]MCY9870425.1 hypothetical protein [Vibrio barjaei]